MSWQLHQAMCWNVMYSPVTDFCGLRQGTACRDELTAEPHWTLNRRSNWYAVSLICAHSLNMMYTWERDLFGLSTSSSALNLMYSPANDFCGLQLTRANSWTTPILYLCSGTDKVTNIRNWCTVKESCLRPSSAAVCSYELTAELDAHPRDLSVRIVSINHRGTCTVWPPGSIIADWSSHLFHSVCMVK